MYTIIGTGRLATHLAKWFDLKSIPYKSWHYKTHSPEQLLELNQISQRLLICIPDRHIYDFVSSFPEVEFSKWIHFSGSLHFEGLVNIHPMMAFSSSPMTLEDYERIEFARFDQNSSCIDDLFPELNNRSFYIPIENKKLYHALCSFSGNLTGQLWSLSAHEFLELGVPKSSIDFYMKKNFENLMSSHHPFYRDSLTGPIVRNDMQVLNQQKLELAKVGFEKIYSEFISLFLNHKRLK